MASNRPRIVQPDPIVNPDPLFTTADAVTYSGLSERMLRRRIADGTLPVVRFGRSVRIRRSALDRYLETGDAR